MLFKNEQVIVANWKMNGSFGEIDNLLDGLECSTELVLCLPFVFLHYLSLFLQKGNANLSMYRKKDHIKIGAQDCSSFANGPYTGDVSASMLKDVGCQYVILGHYERRKYYSETTEVVSQKVMAATLSGLVPIICVGEADAKNKEKEIIEQLSFLYCKRMLDSFQDTKSENCSIVIAYEPVYAVGASAAPINQDIQESVEIIKHEMKNHSSRNIKVLYGGAVDENNAEDILSISGINGLLVGRASLDYKKLNHINELTIKHSK